MHWACGVRGCSRWKLVANEEGDLHFLKFPLRIRVILVFVGMQPVPQTGEGCIPEEGEGACMCFTEQQVRGNEGAA